MYAVIETGGKQYKVAVGDTLKIERLPGGLEEIAFDRVLLVSDGEGDVRVGDPCVKGATVRAAVLGEGKGKKIRGLKYKPKTNYRVRFGHRQPYTLIRVDAIEA